MSQPPESRSANSLRPAVRGHSQAQLDFKGVNKEFQSPVFKLSYWRPGCAVVRTVQGSPGSEGLVGASLPRGLCVSVTYDPHWGNCRCPWTSVSMWTCRERLREPGAVRVLILYVHFCLRRKISGVSPAWFLSGAHIWNCPPISTWIPNENLTVARPEQNSTPSRSSPSG